MLLLVLNHKNSVVRRRRDALGDGRVKVVQVQSCSIRRDAGTRFVISLFASA